MPLTQEDRNNSVAALANSLQKPASLRPESLLLAYVGLAAGKGNAKIIIDQFWNPRKRWMSGTKKVSLITYVEVLDA
jgi:hypothetical protein